MAPEARNVVDGGGWVELLETDARCPGRLKVSRAAAALGHGGR